MLVRYCSMREGLLMATHGQALGVVTFYYVIISAAAHCRHMILDVPFAAPIDFCGKLFEMTASRLRWR